MLLYYITDRRQFPGTDADQRAALLRRIAEAARARVDYIQLREKDLASKPLEQLAREALTAIRQNSASTRLLINSRLDVALAIGADGVHLGGRDINPADARLAIAIAKSQGTLQRNAETTISLACHSVEEVRYADSCGADIALLAPIFEKPGTPVSPLGIAAILRATSREAKTDLSVEAGDRRTSIPVIALGGITVENASACSKAGAAGIAGIRLFQDRTRSELSDIVRRLREL